MFLYKLRPDVELEKTNAGCRLYSHISERYVHWKTGQPLDLLHTLQAEWLSEDAMAELFQPTPTAMDWAGFYYLFQKLISAGFLSARFTQNGKPVFSITPALSTSALQAKPITPQVNYQLCRFTYLRQASDAMVLENPLTLCRMTIHTKELAELLFHLCGGFSVDSLKDEWNALLSALLATEMIAAKNNESGKQKDSLPLWEFHDLLFYARTQKGRHSYPIGGTYRFHGKRKAPAVVKAIAASETISLGKPDADMAQKLDRSFGDILENRRSIRNYAETPIRLDDISAFLFYSARIQGLVEDPAHEDMVSLRPVPSAGARHAFEIYPFIRQCRGGDPGVYRYCPQTHILEKIKSADSDIQKLLAWNPYKAITPIPPQATIYISARIERMTWKYESIAYKLIQQDLGCLYQTFYLVAEALGLAPCALGDVDSDRLGKALDMNWQIEPFIGGFTLGKRSE